MASSSGQHHQLRLKGAKSREQREHRNLDSVLDAITVVLRIMSSQTALFLVEDVITVVRWDTLLAFSRSFVRERMIRLRGLSKLRSTPNRTVPIVLLQPTMHQLLTRIESIKGSNLWKDVIFMS